MAKAVKNGGFVIGFAGRGKGLLNDEAYTSLEIATIDATDLVENPDFDQDFEELVVYELVPRRSVKPAKAQVKDL